MTLITTNDGSGVATSDFTSGIDSTYKLYIFKFIDVNPVTDGAEFGFQANVATASGFDETMTTSYFGAFHNEADSDAYVQYFVNFDQAQGTGYQDLMTNVGNGADESCAGTLWLFNPSNTTYVKHFYFTGATYAEGDGMHNSYVAGYFNVTGAIDEVSFKMSSGNMDAVIKMYGVG